MAKRNSSLRSVERFLQLRHWLMKSEAWKSLDPVARCTYIVLASRYWGNNNGRIPLSVREVAKDLGCGKATALRAFRRLVDRGFIVEMKKGAFHVKVRHASEWRLTEYRCDVTGNLPTKEFDSWKKTAVPPRNPDGCQGETGRVP